MIVVTGGAGFIGSNIIAALEARGQERIVVCDVLGSEDKWRNLAKRALHAVVPPDALLPFLDANMREIEAVIHMGAISSTVETDADLIVHTNFTLTTALWDWAARTGKRIIYASSAATYGDGEKGFVDDESAPFLHALRPLNPYGWSKNATDLRIARMLETRKTVRPRQWAGLKFFNVYGPNEYHKGGQMSVVCTMYPNIVAGNPARLFKSYRDDYVDGGQLRDFVYVRDCADVVMWLLDNPEVSGLYNVGTGKARSFADLARATFAAANLPERIEYIEMPETLRPKYQYFTQADMTKLRRAGYTKPFTELEDGIADYAGNYMSRADRYR